jgi:hypothetical protein
LKKKRKINLTAPELLRQEERKIQEREREGEDAAKREIVSEIEDGATRVGVTPVNT